jgi:hypothetical protein
MAQERVEGFCFFAHFFAFSPNSTSPRSAATSVSPSKLLGA